MRKRQVIQLYRPEMVSKFIPRGSDFHPHGRWAWLQKLLWRWLKRMGTIKSHWEETVEYIRVLIDDEAIINRIGAQLDGIHARGGTPKEALMGPNTFAELMRAPEVRDWAHPFEFETDYRLGRSRTFMGLHVRVIPQMEGVLVIE